MRHFSICLATCLAKLLLDAQLYHKRNPNLHMFLHMMVLEKLIALRKFIVSIMTKCLHRHFVIKNKTVTFSSGLPSYIDNHNALVRSIICCNCKQDILWYRWADKITPVVKYKAQSVMLRWGDSSYMLLFALHFGMHLAPPSSENVL